MPDFFDITKSRNFRRVLNHATNLKSSKLMWPHPPVSWSNALINTQVPMYCLTFQLVLVMVSVFAGLWDVSRVLFVPYSTKSTGSPDPIPPPIKKEIELLKILKGLLVNVPVGPSPAVAPGVPAVDV